jgi:hypothetical protein
MEPFILPYISYIILFYYFLIIKITLSIRKLLKITENN